MTWHCIHSTFSPELAEEYFLTYFSGIYQSEQSKSRSIPEESLCSGNETDTSHHSQFGMTSEHSATPKKRNHSSKNYRRLDGDSPFVAGSLSHVKIFHAPERAPELPAQNPLCGLIWRESLASYDRDTSLWKTAPNLFGEELTLLSGAWPKWGIIRNGELFRLPMWARITSGGGAGCSLKIPTPTAGDNGSGAYYGGGNLKTSGWFKKYRPEKMDSFILYEEALMLWPVGWSSIEPLKSLGGWHENVWSNGAPEPDIPRVKKGVKNRTARIKAIGNGQVCHCAAAAFNHLMKISKWRE